MVSKTSHFSAGFLNHEQYVGCILFPLDDIKIGKQPKPRRPNLDFEASTVAVPIVLLMPYWKRFG